MVSREEGISDNTHHLVVEKQRRVTVTNNTMLDEQYEKRKLTAMGPTWITYVTR
jgi:hypothetical protein